MRAWPGWHDLPTPEQAEVIREVPAIWGRVAVCIVHRERLRHIGFWSRPQEMPTLAAGTGENGVA
jgi:hypothetical protein